MKKLRWLSIMMGLTILGLTGFQAYWLRENYVREERTLAIKSEITFRETVQHLQAVKLNLDFSMDTLKKGKVKIFMSDGRDEDLNFRHTPKNEIISTINIIRDKLTDSLKKDSGTKKGMVILRDNVMMSRGKDSTTFTENIAGPRQNYFYRLLYGVDSLQDSIRIDEINSRLADELQKQKLNIPFAVERLDSSAAEEEPEFNQVTVGFAKPITYRLKLGNTFPYLVKRITLPILFSIFLLGITVLSFVLFYRSLLRQQRLAEIKNEFISNITHELKTPIATVGVAIEALKNFNAIRDPERTKEYLEISSQELQRLSLLVDKVLKLSMFEKQEIELRYEPVNLKEIVDEVTNSMKLQLEKQRAHVTVTPKGDLSMQGDKLHLQSVVFNLLDNAIKYSKKEAAVQIDLEEREDELVMRISDDGIGIPPEYKNRVFDKFFRIPHGDTHNAKGYGLGLSYVAHVVRKHRGTIELDSQPGAGTTFTISFPKSPSV